jgi:hypothetical protein
VLLVMSTNAATALKLACAMTAWTRKQHPQRMAHNAYASIRLLWVRKGLAFMSLLKQQKQALSPPSLDKKENAPLDARIALLPANARLASVTTLTMIHLAYSVTLHVWHVMVLQYSIACHALLVSI